MRTITFVVVVWISATSGALLAQPVEHPDTGHWYEFVSDVLIWSEARDAAVARTWMGLSGHLATITTQEELDYVATQVPGLAGSQAWLGGYQDPPSSPEAENWFWITAEVWDFTAWGPGEPNDHGGPGSESYLIISSDYTPMGWADAGSGTYRYLVEYEASAPVLWADNGHWYQFVADLLTWPEALEAAASRSWMGYPGHLATITTQEELEFVANNVPGLAESQAWLGGYQDPPSSAVAENWYWISDEFWSFTAWGPGEPNDHMGPGSESYLIISSDYTPMGWADAGGGDYRYLVEYAEPIIAEIPATWGRVKALYRDR